MLTLFGTIIFVYAMWLIVKPLVARYMRRKFQEKVNDMFRQAMGGTPGGSSSAGPNEAYGHQQQRQDGRQQARRGSKRKIFSRDEGEYVEFEEVYVQADSTSEASAKCPDTGYTPREPQVSDVEWEEIV